jgi:hypothetical protein
MDTACRVSMMIFSFCSETALPYDFYPDTHPIIIETPPLSKYEQFDLISENYTKEYLEVDNFDLDRIYNICSEHPDMIPLRDDLMIKEASYKKNKEFILDYEKTMRASMPDGKNTEMCDFMIEDIKALMIIEKTQIGELKDRITQLQDAIMKEKRDDVLVEWRHKIYQTWITCKKRSKMDHIYVKDAVNPSKQRKKCIYKAPGTKNARYKRTAKSNDFKQERKTSLETKHVKREEPKITTKTQDDKYGYMSKSPYYRKF